MKKRILSLLLVMVFVLAGCQSSSDKSEDKTTIIYGKAAGPYTVLFEDAIIPILKKEGYQIVYQRGDYCKFDYEG